MTSLAAVLVRLALVSALIAVTAVPGLASDEIASPLGETGELMMAGEFLVRLDAPPDTASTLGLSVEHLGFGIYLLTDHSRANGASTDPLARAGQLSAALGADVVPNRVSRLFADNTEPDAISQWSLENIGQFVGGTPDADIDGEEAWDAATGAGVTVAVIDSGSDMDHPDLAANLWVNPGEVPGNGIDDDGNGFIDDVNGWDFVDGDADPEDTSGSGHGTAVAGIIGAPINGDGIAGVAPDARIMVLRACSFLFCSDGAAIEALYYAANNGAHVANLSFGRASGGDTAFRIAVEDAIADGVVVVAAAGNGGMDGIGDDNDDEPIIPASFGIDGLLSVAMTDHADDLSGSSNFGATSVHLGAPGVSIWTLDLEGGYGFWSGTSFAAPTTAGVAALLRQHRNCWSAETIASVVETSGDPTASLAGKTISGKRLNAFEALAVNAKRNDVVVAPAPAAVSFSGGGAATMWTFGDGDVAVGPTAQHTYDFGLYTASDGTDTYDVAAGLDFLDTCTNRFLTEIMWLSASGITLGCDPVPNFCPDDTVIRSHMASFLARALDLPPASGDYFTDDDGLSHEENINRLREAGVTLGCNPEGTLFCPDEEVTRAQMASFLARALGLTPSGTNWFTDDDGLSHEPNINALADSGITLGCGNDMFCPDAGIERDEMAAFLFRGRVYLP